MTANGVVFIAFGAAVAAQVAMLLLTGPLHDRLTRLHGRNLLPVAPVPLSRWGRMTLRGMSYVLSLRAEDIPDRETLRRVRIAQALVVVMLIGVAVAIVALFVENS